MNNDEKRAIELMEQAFRRSYVDAHKYPVTKKRLPVISEGLHSNTTQGVFGSRRQLNDLLCEQKGSGKCS